MGGKSVSSLGSAVLRLSLNLGLLVISLTVGALLAEGLSRVILNRVDYLAVNPVYDSVLGLRVASHAAGHDEWGFRNHQVPDSAAVVTIGDSQTYGISAPAHLSWPAQLEALTGSRVYNLALGGYGPVQYYELLRTRALSLRPKVIVVGFYFGNDVWDAYATVYGLRHWTVLRREGIPPLADTAQVPLGRGVFLDPVRDWLARHSVVYRLATLSAIGEVARNFEFNTRGDMTGVARFQGLKHGLQTGFTPILRLKALDLDDVAVREGLRLSLDRLERMFDECRTAGVHLLVVLVPTKERVFAKWLARRRDLAELETFHSLLRNEDEANRRVRERLLKIGAPYLDLEIPLRRAAAVKAIYPSNEDGHPNSDGYAVIAQAVAREIRDWLR